MNILVNDRQLYPCNIGGIVMHPFSSRSLFLVISVFLTLVGSTLATVTRTAEAQDSGAVRVCLTWSFETVPTSAIVISETIPPGWTAVLSPESEPIVDAIRTSEDSVNFLIGLHALSIVGSMTYELVPPIAREETLSFSGTYSLSQGVLILTDEISGSMSCVSCAPVPDIEANVEMVKIVSFELTEGTSPRVTVGWTGTESGQEVHIEWCPVNGLKQDESSSRGVGLAGETVTPGWTDFWSVDTASPSGGVLSTSKVLDGTPKSVYQATPDKDAQPGFYRLRIVQ